MAFAEYGRIAKSEHLLRVVDPVDDTYRPQMNWQLTARESRHELSPGRVPRQARDRPPGVPRWDGGPARRAWPVLNAIVLWTTRCIDAAVVQLKAEGHEFRDEDITWLSPLKHRNLNLLGRYGFPPPRPQAALRPPRGPDALELDEDEDEDESAAD